MENQFLELGMVIISKKLLNKLLYKEASINKMLFFHDRTIYFSLQLLVYLFNGKDLVGVSMIPPLRGLGNDTSNPLYLSSVNGLENLILPSLTLSLSNQSLSLIIYYKVST